MRCFSTQGPRDKAEFLVFLCLRYCCHLDTLILLFPHPAFPFFFPSPRLRSGCESKLWKGDRRQDLTQACACASTTQKRERTGCPVCRMAVQALGFAPLSPRTPMVWMLLRSLGLGSGGCMKAGLTPHILPISGYVWRPVFKLENCKKEPLTRGTSSRKVMKMELIFQGTPALMGVTTAGLQPR